MFIHVTETDVVQTTSSYGVQFSKELIGGLLGLATGAGALSFASAMIASIGKEGVRIQSSKSKVDTKVANIVFVCEYLLGMPIVSAIVVYAEVDKITETLKTGPCYQSSSTKTETKLHKDTYMFVTPAFIRQYAKDLLTVETDPDYTTFVEYLKSLLKQTA